MAEFFSMRIGMFLLGAALLATMPASAQYPWGPALTNSDIGSDTPWGRVHFDPTNSSTVWATTTQVPDPFATDPLPPANGIWKSEDAGSSWTMMSNGELLPAYQVLDFTICKADPSVLYAAAMEFGVFRTDDGGANWTAVNTGLPFPDDKIGAGAIVVDPTNPDRAYVSVGQLGGIDILSPSPNHPGFYYTNDGGMSWTANNGTLPNRNDSFVDLVSTTSVAASLVIPENEPTTIYAGFLQAEANGKLLFGKNAVANTLVYRNTTSGEGTWTNLSEGLPKVGQADSGIGSVLRYAISGGVLSVSTIGPNHVLYLSILGAGGEVDILGDDATKFKSKGIYALAPGSTTWIARNRALPVVSDEENDEAINTTPVAIHPSNPYIALTGVLDADIADPGATKIWATTTAGDPWLKNWGDSGLGDSPTLAFPYANAAFIEISSDARRAVASVLWSSDDSDDTADDGVYIVPRPGVDDGDTPLFSR